MYMRRCVVLFGESFAVDSPSSVFTRPAQPASVPAAGVRSAALGRRKALPPEPKDGGKCCERSASLQCKDLQRLSGNPWQPLDCEERHDRHLSSHEELKNMGCGPFVGLMGRRNTEYRKVTQRHGKGREGHD